MVNRYIRSQNSLTLNVIFVAMNLDVTNHNFQVFKSWCNETPEIMVIHVQICG